MRDIVFRPFLHEDVAIIMAAAFIHQCKLPIFQAFGSVYAGVIVSDVSIYWLGRAARCAPRLRRFLNNEKLQKAQTWLKKNRVFAIGLCHVLPGLLFSTFAACGWFGMTFLQFFVPAFVTSLVYTVLLLLLVLKFGALMHLGSWGWFRLLLFTVAVLFVLSRLIKAHLCRLRAVREGKAPCKQPSTVDN